MRVLLTLLVLGMASPAHATRVRIVRAGTQTTISKTAVGHSVHKPARRRPRELRHGAQTHVGRGTNRLVILSSQNRVKVEGHATDVVLRHYEPGVKGAEAKVRLRKTLNAERTQVFNAIADAAFERSLIQLVGTTWPYLDLATPGTPAQTTIDHFSQHARMAGADLLYRGHSNIGSFSLTRGDASFTISGNTDRVEIVSELWISPGDSAELKAVWGHDVVRVYHDVESQPR